MKKNKKKGFTLVELLAVIVVLAIILVIAVPKILDVIKSSRENSLISSVKLVARNAEQKKLANEVLGEDEDFDCSEVADLSENDYQSCTINFDTDGNATVTITGKGKFSGYTCSGTKNNVTCGDAEPLVCKHYVYDNFRIKINLSDAKKDECVDKLEEKYLAIDIPAELALPMAKLICKNEYPEDEPEEEFYNSVPFEEHNINGLIKWFIYDQPIFKYEDIKDYFDADAECKINYMSNQLRELLEHASLTELVEFYDDEGKSILNKISGLEGIDVSEARDESILAYEVYDSDSELYDVYIVSDDKIYFPEDSSYLFEGYTFFQNIKFINFNTAVDTSNVEDMSGMFAYCNTLEELDLSNFNTGNVTTMENMFGVCDSLEELDLSSFDTSNVANMSEMFSECRNLEHIYVSDKWIIEQVNDNDNDMFYNCSELPNFDNNYVGVSKAYVGDGGYLSSI